MIVDVARKDGNAHGVVVPLNNGDLYENVRMPLLDSIAPFPFNSFVINVRL